MHVPQDAYVLRVFVGESDRWQGKPAYEAITLKARELRLAGATVFRGSLGYGATSRLHTIRLLVSEDLPVVVEIIDTKEKIDELLPHIDQMLTGGLVVLEKVQILKQRKDAGPPEKSPSD